MTDAWTVDPVRRSIVGAREHATKVSSVAPTLVPIEGPIKGPMEAAISACIVPIDFSPPSMMALQWAAFLANASALRVIALHALQPSHVASTDRTVAAQIDDACERMTKLCEPFATGVSPMEVVATIADPVDAIVQESQRVEHPMIVMGNRGLSRLRRVFLGSVADRVERAAQCPVLVVHEDNEPPERVSTRGDDVLRDHVLRAVIGIDFHRSSEVALAGFRALARGIQRAGSRVEITLISVLQQAQYVDVSDVPVVMAPDFGALEQDTTERLRRVAKALRIEGFIPQIVVDRGDAALRILQCARENRADMIVVGRHAQHPLSRLLLGSTAERVLHGSRVPVLTARDATTASISSSVGTATAYEMPSRPKVQARIVT